MTTNNLLHVFVEREKYYLKNPSAFGEWVYALMPFSFLYGAATVGLHITNFQVF